MRSVPYFFALYITAMLFIFPDISIASASAGISLCRDVIIPSLFPFFVCSGLLIYSGFTKHLSKIAEPFMKPLFNVAGAGASALVLGTVSGYPLGAVTACQLYESGYLSKTETERLLAFCNNSGPLFILGVVGVSIYADAKIGVVLYVCHILATFLVGILFRFWKKDSHTAPKYAINQNSEEFSLVFQKVLANSINSILTICGAVIFFSVISGVVKIHLPANELISSLISAILELTGGTKAISETHLPLTVKLVLSAFTVGFAGFCVHLQVASVVAKHYLSLAPYILGKVLHGFFSSAFTFIYFMLFPIKTEVFKNIDTPMSAGFCMSSMFSVITILFFIVSGILAAIISANITKLILQKDTKKGRMA